MALDRRAREQMRALCGEIHEDDGVDPREFFKAGRSRRKPDHKTARLCGQVAQTIDQILAGETGDDDLRCLRVASVRPAPDASRMLVSVVADAPGGDFNRARAETRLQAASGRLRTAVAAAITRRKAPSLLFVLLGPGPEESAHE